MELEFGMKRCESDEILIIPTVINYIKHIWSGQTGNSCLPRIHKVLAFVIVALSLLCVCLVPL